MYKSLSTDELYGFQKLWVETRPEYKTASKALADAEESLEKLMKDPAAAAREFLDGVIEGRKRVSLAKAALAAKKQELEGIFARQLNN
jgi:hypothetical protein